jgi:hypothetical protein
VGSFETVAVNACAELMGMIPLVGFMFETTIAGTVALVATAFAGFATGVAVIFTVKSLDDSGGAV